MQERESQMMFLSVFEQVKYGWLIPPVIFLIAIILVICNPPPSAAEKEAMRQQAIVEMNASDAAECHDMGFTPNTDPFAQCMLTLRTTFLRVSRH